MSELFVESEVRKTLSLLGAQMRCLRSAHWTRSYPVTIAPA